MQEISPEDFAKIAGKLQEFMRYCQKVESGQSYLIVNRNSPILSEAAQKAAEKLGLEVRSFDLGAKKPYKHFPKKLITLLRHETPNAGIGLFDYSKHPDWSLKELGARIELLHKTIEETPISWAHSPGITLDMAVNGPLQCDYKKMAADSKKVLDKLANIKKIQITAAAGTDIEIEVPTEVKFDTDCIIQTPNIYGKPGKFGNLPVGEVWSQKGNIIRVENKRSGKPEIQSYPVKQYANGKLVCDLVVGGYHEKIDPQKPLIATFKNGVLTELQCSDPALDKVREEILTSQLTYGLPTVLEELGIGLNDRARVTGNMLEDEKLKGTCHLAPGNIRCHVDMLIDKPTITGYYKDGKIKEIMKKGALI